ncbi:MAG: chorismate-binding protein [Candidatus Sericytochromatia bacterium]|nr:chorismate-binding protein [Candidatus Tanganyikabacteria bacterium]
MSAVAVPTARRSPVDREWGDAIRAGVLTARARKARLLVSLPFSLEVPSLWRLAAAARGKPTFAWWGAGDRQAVLGLGSALVQEAREAAAVPALIRRVAEGLIPGRDASLAANVDPALIRAHGGIAFDPAWPGRDVPAARFAVPAVSLRQAPADAPAADGAIHVLVCQWDGARDVADRAARALAWIRRLAAAAERGSFAPPAGWRLAHPRQGKDRFSAAVERAVLEIRRGGLDKVVVSRDADLVPTEPEAPPDAWASFAAMAAAAPETCRYAFFDAAGAGMLGASPERLVEIDDGAIRADCLAGTAWDDRAGAKERREFDHVAAGLRATLEPLCDGLTMAPEPVWRPVPGLAHLWTPLAGRLRAGARVDEVVAAVHPTPAVAGSPRDAAMALIRYLEGRPRGWYAGAIGWIAPGEADLAVAIRAIRFADGAAHLTVGAGIVAGSEPEREWEETSRKAAAILGMVTG